MSNYYQVTGFHVRESGCDHFRETFSTLAELTAFYNNTSVQICGDYNVSVCEHLGTLKDLMKTHERTLTRWNGEVVTFEAFGEGD